MGTVHLKMMKLEGSGQTELVAVNSALKQISECFRDVTGTDRQFVIGVQKLNDKNHPAHLCIEMGLGLVQLLRWIVEDELGIGQVAHLIPQVNLCQNCQLNSVQMNHVLGAPILEDLDQLLELQMTLF